MLKKNVYSINKQKGICKIFINLKENEKKISNNNNNNNIGIITFIFLRFEEMTLHPELGGKIYFHPLHLFDQTLLN